MGMGRGIGELWGVNKYVLECTIFLCNETLQKGSVVKGKNLLIGGIFFPLKVDTF